MIGIKTGQVYTAVSALDGLKAFPLGPPAEHGFASERLAKACHLKSQAYQENFRPRAVLRRCPAECLNIPCGHVDQLWLAEKCKSVRLLVMLLTKTDYPTTIHETLAPAACPLKLTGSSPLDLGATTDARVPQALSAGRALRGVRLPEPRQILALQGEVPCRRCRYKLMRAACVRHAWPMIAIRWMCQLPQ